MKSYHDLSLTIYSVLFSARYAQGLGMRQTPQ